MKSKLKELNETEKQLVRKIGNEIQNEMKRDKSLAEINQYSIDVVSYLTYLAIKQKIKDVPELIKYLEESLDDNQYDFVREMIGNSWSLPIELKEKYTEENTLDVIFWSHLFFSDKHDMFETPRTVIKIANNILNTSKGRVADLCSGSGNYLASTISKESNKASYYGVELNQNLVSWSSLKLSILSQNVEIVNGSVFDIDEKLLFDSILCHYPWRELKKQTNVNNETLKNLEGKYPELSDSRNTDWLFITNTLEHLSDTGKAVAVVPLGITMINNREKEIRRRIVEQGYIETVIVLPKFLGKVGLVPTTILVLSKKKSKSIRMVDASSLEFDKNNRNELDDESIKNIIEMCSRSNDKSSLVSIEEIEKNDFSINPAEYVGEKIEIKNAHPFKQIIKRITRGTQLKQDELDKMLTSKETDLQYLSLANIQDGIIEEELDYLDNIDSKKQKYCAKNGNLVLSKNGNQIKVAVVNTTQNKRLLVNGNLYIIELDESIMNPYYLQAFLESDQGQKSLSKLTLGQTLPSIPVDKLKQMNVPVPNMDEQEKIAKELKKTQTDIKRLRKKLEIERDNLKKIYKG